MFTQAVKSANERQVIQVLRQGRVVTKQELAEACGLSFPTAGKLVDELVEQGVVLEAGLETAKTIRQRDERPGDLSDI